MPRLFTQRHLFKYLITPSTPRQTMRPSSGRALDRRMQSVWESTKLMLQAEVADTRAEMWQEKRGQVAEVADRNDDRKDMRSKSKGSKGQGEDVGEG